MTDNGGSADPDLVDNNDILEKDYCPPLDTALFYAVLGDLDPGNPRSLHDVRQVLESLKESATLEQGTDFDPSGTTDQDAHDDSTAFANLADLSVTEDSTNTSVTEASIHANSVPDVYDEGIEELTESEKANLLSELCPEASLFDIQFTLKKYKGSFRKSLDDILNLLWIKENHTIQRSVDGFFQETPRMRKAKGKNKSKTSHQPDHENHHDDPPRQPQQQNVWQLRKKQIDFIASRVHLSESLISSEYYKAGGSQRATILSLCKVDLSSVTGVSTEDTIIQMNAAELGQDFPRLSSEECIALVILTHPFTARAHELAKAVFTTSTGTSTPDSSLRLIPQYAQLQLDDKDPSEVSPSHQSATIDMTQPSLRQAAANHAIRREQMFTKANAAWRKSKSNPLMGGAAAYYSDEGRKANVSTRAYTSAAADLHIHNSATNDSIDLHGVNVQDAIRNARAAVQSWWNSGSAEWAREGKALGGNGFTIITGAGTHSVGGKAKIRPAVVKMLKTEGWRIEEDSVRGQVQVLGRLRAR